jgi:hypothetical protein
MLQKVTVGIILLAVGAGVYLYLLPPRSLDCDVGIDGLSIRLHRNGVLRSYTVRVDVAPEADIAASLPRSADLPAEQVPSLQAILAVVGVPRDREIGSKEFREAYCHTNE